MNLLKAKEEQFFILEDYHNQNNVYFMINKFRFVSRHTKNQFLKSNYRDLKVKILRVK